MRFRSSSRILTQPILGAVDTAVAGHLDGASYLGGVALGGLFFNFVFWGFGFLRMGTTGLVAQSHGARDDAGLRDNVVRALLLAARDRRSGARAASAADRLRAARASAAARRCSATRGFTAMRASGRRRSRSATTWCSAGCWGPSACGLALLSQVFINGVNIVAVFVYVHAFDWGVAGIGAATATADALGFVLGAALLRHGRPRGLPALNRQALFDAPALRRLVVLNRDIFVRTLCLLLSFGWFAHLGARQGDATLAANALLLNFQTFMAYALDGFAHAAEALVGAAIGARDRHAFVQAVKVTALWSALGACGFALVYAGAGSWVVEGLTDQASVRATAELYLPWGGAFAGGVGGGLCARRRVYRRDGGRAN